MATEQHRTLVTAHVPERQVAEAEAVLDAAPRVDVAARREEYAKGGWRHAGTASPI